MAARKLAADPPPPPPSPTPAPPVLGAFVIVHRIEFPAGLAAWATPQDLENLEQRIMSKLSDLIAAAQAEADAAVARVTADVDTLNAKIAELQAKVDAGEASAEDEAALQHLQDTLKGLDPKQPDVIPEPVPPQ
jgi:hypothetical protein